MMVLKQASHSVDDTLASSGLGDAQVREDAEDKRAKANADKKYAAMINLVEEFYNKQIDPALRGDSRLAVTVAQGLQAGELYMPDLDSNKYGKPKNGDDGKRAISRRGGRYAGFEQHDFLDDVRRVREDSRGDDASEVVREIVRRVEAAVLGAVAPALWVQE
jgi:hypothetical protein